MVTVGQTNVNHELLTAGLVWRFTRYDKSTELADLEAAARNANVGLWADPAPVAPWDWRATEAVRTKVDRKRPSKASPAKRAEDRCGLMSRSISALPRKLDNADFQVVAIGWPQRHRQRQLSAATHV